MANQLQSLQFFLQQVTFTVPAMNIDMLPRAIQHLQHLGSPCYRALSYLQYEDDAKRLAEPVHASEKDGAFMIRLPVI